MRSRRTITVVGCHVGGEVGNVVVDGVGRRARGDRLRADAGGGRPASKLRPVSSKSAPRVAPGASKPAELTNVPACGDPDDPFTEGSLLSGIWPGGHVPPPSARV